MLNAKKKLTAEQIETNETMKKYLVVGEYKLSEAGKLLYQTQVNETAAELDRGAVTNYLSHYLAGVAKGLSDEYPEELSIMVDYTAPTSKTPERVSKLFIRFNDVGTAIGKELKAYIANAAQQAGDIGPGATYASLKDVVLPQHYKNCKNEIGSILKRGESVDRETYQGKDGNFSINRAKVVNQAIRKEKQSAKRVETVTQAAEGKEVVITVGDAMGYIRDELKRLEGLVESKAVEPGKGEELENTVLTELVKLGKTLHDSIEASMAKAEAKPKARKPRRNQPAKSKARKPVAQAEPKKAAKPRRKAA